VPRFAVKESVWNCSTERIVGVERAEKSHEIGLGGAKEDATGSGCLFQAIVRMLEVDPCV
jgi:hypothetical protein